MIHLYVAYFATWAIHIAYLVFLSRKARRLRREWQEMGKPD